MILKIFQGFSLFSYQCSLSCFLRQLVYFIKPFRFCQELFYFCLALCELLSCDSLFILSNCYVFVKNFFYLPVRSSPNQCGSRVSFDIITPVQLKVNNYFIFFCIFFSHLFYTTIYSLFRIFYTIYIFRFLALYAKLPLFFQIRTTGSAGGLLTPYKGSFPAFESKDSSNLAASRNTFTYRAPWAQFNGLLLLAHP